MTLSANIRAYFYECARVYRNARSAFSLPSQLVMSAQYMNIPPTGDNILYINIHIYIYTYINRYKYVEIEG